jgi:hypothetical protein
MPRLQIYVSEKLLQRIARAQESMGMDSITEFGRYALSRAVRLIERREKDNEERTRD